MKGDNGTGNEQVSIKHKKTTEIVCLFITIIILFLVFVFWIKPLSNTWDSPEVFRQWVLSRGAKGIISYIVAVIWQILIPFIPGEFFEIIAGYAFGSFWGTVWCMIGESIGSIVVILVSRYRGQPILELFFSKEKIDGIRFLQYSPKKALLFSIAFILPGTPKDLLCYYSGLTKIPLPIIILICSIGRFPSVVTSTIGGDGLGSKRYVFAIIVFIVTGLLSVLGILIYSWMKKKHEGR